MKNKILVALLFITLNMTPKVKAIDWDKAAGVVGIVFMAGKLLQHSIKVASFSSLFSERYDQDEKNKCALKYFVPRFAGYGAGLIYFSKPLLTR